MKTYSLNFYSSDLEEKFQEQNMRKHFSMFGQHLRFYGCIAFIVSVISFSMGNWILGTLCFSYVMQLPLIYYIAKKGPKYFDYLCFAFQTSLNFSVPIAYLLNEIVDTIADADSYMIGQAITLIALSFNLGSRFYLKSLMIILNMIPQLYIKLVLKKDVTGLFALWLGSNIMVLNQMYWQDRIQRESFLIKYNEKVWQQQIGKSAQISILCSISDNGHLILDNNKCNDVSQKEFKISNMDSYKQLLNDFKLIPSQQFNLKIVQKLRSQAICKNVQSLHSWTFKYSNQTQLDQKDFIGLYNSSLYDVKMFNTWNDQLLNIHTLITKSLIQTESKTNQIIQNDRQIFNDYRQKCGTLIKKIIIQTKNKIHIQGQQSIDQSLLCNAYESLRMNYNLQLFMNPNYELKFTYFLLKPLIEQINNVARTNMPKPYYLSIECEIIPSLKLYSCYKTIFHIVFNIYSTILARANKSGYIRLIANERYSLIGQLIEFQITTDITSVKYILDNQNYCQDIQDKNRHLYQTEKKIGLELIISEFQVGKIGPYRRLQLKHSLERYANIRFFIFKDIRVIK